MKKILTASLLAAMMAGSAVQAGGLGEPAMAPEEVKAPASSASGIIVPLLLLLLIAAAASGGGGGGNVNPG